VPSKLGGRDRLREELSRTILRARCIGKAPDNPKIPFGDRIVETDWRLFCTLVRFDAVYHGHFKCNIRRIGDYPNLDGYLQCDRPLSESNIDYTEADLP
jgi:putative glutathione S-transferase